MCDDIDLVLEADRIVEAENACALGKARFFGHPDAPGPACTIRAQPASLEEGIELAARILAEARNPLVYGLNETTCEAQSRAVAIADWIGGTVDFAASSQSSPFVTALEAIGEVTATLGEIRNRADLVIYWGVDPAESHPRHAARYALMPQGLFVPRGRADRTCVVVDARKTATAEDADVALQIRPESDFEALWALRALAKGLELDPARVESDTGLPLATWADLAEWMKRARYGAIFFGVGLLMSRGKNLVGEAVLSLTREMNQFTRFVCQPMCGAGNATGAENVFAWSTGYPLGVNFARGYPRFNPGEYTAHDLLARREVDAALILAEDPTAGLSRDASEHLASIPRITIGPKETPFTQNATVAFASAPYGVSATGTVYRMDGIPLPLRPVLGSAYPSDEEILARLERRIRGLR